MRKLFRYSFLLFILCLFIAPAKTWADSADFAVKKIDSPEQIREANFYNILVTPKTATNINVNISNQSDQENTYTISMYSGITNNVGKVAYSATATSASEKQTMHYLSPETQTVSIPANSQKDFSIPIKTPEAAEPGIILGAVHVEKHNAKTKVPKKGAQIINHYAIEIPVVVRTMPASTPQLDLQLNNVTLGLDASRKPAILANLYNNSNWVMTPLKIDTQVYRVNRSGKKYVAHYKDLEMAPNSSFNSSVTPKEPLKPGKYHLTMTAKSGKQVWHFDKYFTINQAAIDKTTKNAINPPKKSYLYIWIIIGFLLLLLIILYLMYKLHQKNKALKQSAE
ncbi:DUF3324 domain-containing protein [Latilactobacillus curvatus]|uniref:DUF3324 domain-containing protein n=1 Tax=Latilactobacillus curvatus TaxID=28038 RepID=UPI0021A7DD7E|nr:DUF3324 domain-containing protein [Latilactobacillus curvatus]MCT3359274.1 DUF3324 domain-containing protein [Latilactobacillus curvatus]